MLAEHEFAPLISFFLDLGMLHPDTEQFFFSLLCVRTDHPGFDWLKIAIQNHHLLQMLLIAGAAISNAREASAIQL